MALKIWVRRSMTEQRIWYSGPSIETDKNLERMLYTKNFFHDANVTTLFQDLIVEKDYTLTLYTDFYTRIHAFISIIICVFGILGNLVNLIVFTRKSMSTSTNLILTGLALADITLLCFYVPIYIDDFRSMSLFHQADLDSSSMSAKTDNSIIEHDFNRTVGYSNIMVFPDNDIGDTDTYNNGTDKFHNKNFNETGGYQNSIVKFSDKDFDKTGYRNNTEKSLDNEFSLKGGYSNSIGGIHDKDFHETGGHNDKNKKLYDEDLNETRDVYDVYNNNYDEAYDYNSSGGMHQLSVFYKTGDYKRNGEGDYDETVDSGKPINWQRLLFLNWTSFNQFLVLVIHTASIWLTVTTAIWRFMYVCYPVNTQRWLSLCRAKLATVMTCIACILINVPEYLRRTVYKYFTFQSVICKRQNFSMYIIQPTSLDKLSLWLFVSFSKILPCMFVSSISVCLVRVSIKTNRIRERINAVNATNKQNNKTTKMLLCIMSVFLLTHLPYGIIVLLSEAFDLKYFHQLSKAFAETADFLSLLNSSVNIFFYYSINSQFREICSLSSIAIWWRNHKVFDIARSTAMTSS